MKRFLNAWTIIGLALVVFGWGPLLAIIFLAEIGVWPDPNPNPIGPGLLFFFTAWPAIICLGIGIIWGIIRPHRDNKKQLANKPATTNTTKPAHKPTLTTEQQAYVSSGSFAGGLGIFYFIYMHATGAFFRHFWSNLYWPRMVAHAREWAWEGGNWPDFDTFKYRSDQADSTAKILLAIFLPVVAILLFL